MEDKHIIEKIHEEVFNDLIKKFGNLDTIIDKECFKKYCKDKANDYSKEGCSLNDRVYSLFYIKFRSKV